MAIRTALDAPSASSAIWSERCREHAHEHEVQRPANHRQPHERRLDEDHHGRDEQQEREREDQDVPARVAPRDEELGRVGQHVEQRLGEREAPEHRQVNPGDQEVPAGPGTGVLPGGASP
jgi:hypothetical protein